MVGSLDECDLYPSINTKVAGKICRDRVIKSNINFEGIDYKSTVIYLQVAMSPSEKVDAKIMKLLPRRVNKQGKKSTVKSTLGDGDEEMNKWWHPKDPKTFSQEDKKLIMGCITQQLVKIVFRSHLYTRNNQIYHQQDGAPMGLESSCPVSRVLMDHWAEAIKENGERM